jgi:4-amino-4-deoxy-L-arabinose transferase-like glycosyltransferase
MIRNKKAGFVLGGLELVAAFQAWRVWVAAFTSTAGDEFTQLLQSFTLLLSGLLVLLPVGGLVFVFRNKRWGYLLLAAFPLLSIIFGITAFPFVHYFYGKDAMLNSLFIAVINALVCAFAFWLFVSAKSHFPKATNLQSPGEVK